MNFENPNTMNKMLHINKNKPVVPESNSEVEVAKQGEEEKVETVSV